MVCFSETPGLEFPSGEALVDPRRRGDACPVLELRTGTVLELGCDPLVGSALAIVAEADDPFDDFDDDDFDDEFDDDFEEDWEDDLTEDEEFPDTFGGEEEETESEETEGSPFSDDPDFDED